MNARANLSAILSFTLIWFSCGGESTYIPNEEDKKVGDVYARLALLSEFNRLQPHPDTGAVYQAKVDSVLAGYQMTREEFKNRWDDLSSSSERTRAVLDVAAKRLEILRREAR
jgi:hypothetical protein